MAVMKSKDGDNMAVACSCGCDEGIRIKMNKCSDDTYMLITYTNGNFYRDQNDGFWASLGKKLKKIWAIISNKDYCYSEICMTKKDFEEFKEFLTEFDQENE